MVLDGMVEVVAAGRQHRGARGHHPIRLILHHQKTALVIQFNLQSAAFEELIY